MQKQEIEDLKIELKKYEDKTTGIEIQGSINLFFHIDNMKTFISKQTIILSDCKENELRIENHYINDVIIEKNKIILEFERRLWLNNLCKFRYLVKKGENLMKNLKELQEEIDNKYNNKDISIRFEGSIRTYFIIENSRSLVTKRTILIGSLEKDNQEIKIDLADVEEINISLNIELKMNGNYTIYLYYI